MNRHVRLPFALVATGLSAAALVALGRSAGWDAGDTASAATLVGLCAGAWGWAGRGWRADLADAERRAAAQHERAADAARSAETMLADCAAEIDLQCTHSQAEIGRLRAILADAIDKLLAAFGALHALSARQKDLALGIVGEGGRARPMVALIDRTKDTLHTVVLRAQAAQQDAAGLVGQMQAIHDGVNAVAAALVEVEGLASRTSRLAHDAAREAERAGHPGGGLAVVADEVRALSEHTRDFSLAIRAQVGTVHDRIGAAQGAIVQMAAEGRRSAERGEVDLAAAMDSIRALDDDHVVKARALDAIADEVERNVALAVTTLQFQDLANQLLAHTQLRLAHTQRMAEGLPVIAAATVAANDADLARAAASTRATAGVVAVLADVRATTHRNPVLHAEMTQGDVELF